MQRFVPGQAVSRVLVILAILQVGLFSSASASVISATPTLPMLGVPYGSAVGAGCFPTAGVCIEPGTLVQTSLVAQAFVPAGQDITTNTSYTGTLTNLSHMPIGSLVLTGTIRELIEGRTSATQTGTWTTRLLDLSLTGTVLGATLTVTLDPAHDTVGSASVLPVGGGSHDGQFLIDSYYDLYLALALDARVPLATTRGPVRVTAGEVPEPASVTLLGAAILGLIGAGRRRWISAR